MYKKTAAHDFDNILSKNGKPMTKTGNHVAKGEIAHHEQFLLLPQCFQNLAALASV